MERKNSSPQPSTGTATAPKLAFGFSKKLAQPKVLETSAISDPSTFQTKEETDYVLEVNEAGVKGTLVQAAKKGPLVIPCKAVNDWAVKGKETRKRPEEVAEEEEEEETEAKRRKIEGEERERKKGGNGQEGKGMKNGSGSPEDEAVKELLEEAK